MTKKTNEENDANDLINQMFKEFNISVVRYRYSDEHIKNYKELNKDKIKETQKRYVEKNRPQVNANHREYYAKNIEKMRKYLRDRAREKKEENGKIQN